ncbi:hypothetical protein Lal_00039774 [Lupinus albus]|nr:hypothetical protein Lal_00039774 [Lupinus albus]
MNNPKLRCIKTTELTGNTLKHVVPNTLLGNRDPYYALELQLTRLSKFEGRAITPTAYTNLSWMSESGFLFPQFLRNQGVQVFVEMYDEDLMVDVGSFAWFDHPHGTLEKKWMSAFAPVKAFRSMMRDSKRSEATNRSRASTLDVEYRLMYTLLTNYLVPRDANHDEPAKDDLNLMFARRENIRVDWPLLVLLNMLDFSTSTSGALGYPTFISRIIEHDLVDVSNIAFIRTNISQHFLLSSFIHHQLDTMILTGFGHTLKILICLLSARSSLLQLMIQIRIRSYIRFNTLKWMLMTKKKKKKKKKKIWKRIQMMINPSLDKPS